jgi:hypothetical protein
MSIFYSRSQQGIPNPEECCAEELDKAFVFCSRTSNNYQVSLNWELLMPTMTGYGTTNFFVVLCGPILFLLTPSATDS